MALLTAAFVASGLLLAVPQVASAAPSEAVAGPDDVHSGEPVQDIEAGGAPPEVPWTPDWEYNESVDPEAVPDEAEPTPEPEPSTAPTPTPTAEPQPESDPDATATPDATDAPDSTEAPEGDETDAATPEATAEAAPAPDTDEAQPLAAPEAQDELSQLDALQAPSPNMGSGIKSSNSYEEFPIFGDAMDLQVNIGTGNLFARTDILSLNGAGVPATVSAVYNSNNSTTGSLKQWMTDVQAVGLNINAAGTTASFWDGTFAQYTFTKNGSQWTSPSGVNAKLTQSGSNYVITYNRTGEKLTVNSQGWPLTRTDRNGVGITYGYDGTRLTSVTDSVGKSIGLEYVSDTLDTVGDFTGRVSAAYSDNVKLNQLDRAGYGLFKFEYLNTGKLSKITLGDKTAQIAYVGDSSQVATITQTKGAATPIVTTFTYTDGKTAVKDGRGNTSQFFINGEYQVTKTVDPLNRQREQEWTPNGDVAMSTSGFASGSTGAQTAITYDSLNNQTNLTLPTGAATQALYAQGPNCQSAQSGHPYLPKCTIDDAGNSESLTYDTAGNLTKRTNTTAGSAAESFTYTYGNCGGKPGQVCSATDGNGNATKYTYTNGVVTKVTPPAPLGATTYAYDGVHRVKSVTNGLGHTTSYQYNSADRVVKTTFANGATLVTTYNGDGSIATETDSASSKTITYTYNVLGLTTRQQMTGSPTVDMTYDANGNLTRFAAGTTNITHYAYDAANQMIRLSTPGGNCDATGNPGCVRYEYDSDGKEKARLFPNGARQDTTRDESGRPLRITAKDKNGVARNDIAYSYTAGGADRRSIQTRTSHQEQNIPIGAITTYTYDSRSRLTNAVEKYGNNTTASWAYQYDKADNRTKQIRTGQTGKPAATIDYTYNGANQLTGATGSTGAWTYDAAGNQTRGALSGVASTYGDRLQATANGATAYTTFGQGNNRQLTAGGNTRQQTALGVYEYGTNKPVYRTGDGTAVAGAYDATGGTGYFATDHLGSTTGIFRADGTWVAGYTYSPYGEQRIGIFNDTNQIRYLGEHMEGSGNTALYKLGARYYDPGLGRFTQMDPSGQESNPYSYGTCDPINGSDPTGLDYACEVAVGLTFYAVNGLNGYLFTTVGGAIGAALAVGLEIGSIFVEPLMC